MLEFMDQHCHLDDPKFDADRAEAVHRMLQAGVVSCVDCGSDIESSRRVMKLAAEYPGIIYAACGIHPHESEKADDGDMQELCGLLKDPAVVALGEIGLDYYYDSAWREKQKKVLLDQMALALEADKPAVFHIRDAHGDMVGIFRSMAKRPRGVIHCFSGSAETAMEYVRMGFYISFAGPLTFKKAPNLERACALVPEDRLLVETDSPYMAPVPFRGQRNEPAYAVKVLEKMALLRGRTVEEMARVTLNNTREVYGLK